MLLLANNYLSALETKYSNTIVVKWVWAVVILIAVIGTIGYAIYCTWQGGSFAGGIKLGVPDFVHVTFNCKK
ncbi:hypothetical protein CKN86_04345 [Carnobacterium divergens]|uniref:hypothetical protein n=1 Tax=Carnobacterium divergens TaxID=2748 RepID=UPI000D486A1D|nr:hypothetical protein [Carnobacterium divergens]MCO6018689.1 hypothetical protein [Carnobacterium divergens]MPQ22959.1 hypothetical protein [Carnobacterium divergens]TFI63985.1 hypothetical protein CKN62_04380 [Carnobacterium divergens]TFI91148.1 hypothetical protein CKN84_04380 [Carnobacterium divergens]TFJ06015.1 hypothetical protein CKN86_04345 [Carnobacterium divergens]